MVTQKQIRLASNDDIDGIVNVITNYARETGGRTVQGGEVRKAVEAGLKSSERDIYVALDDGTVTGYVAVHWIPFPMLAGIEGYISDLIISPRNRGDGLGSRLLDIVERQAREKGCIRLMLNNAIESESFARAFYPKRGFRQRVDFANFVKPIA